MKTWLRKIIGATVLMSLSCIAFADPPPFSGVVERNEAAIALTFIDAKAGLRVIVGADIDEFCAGTINFDLVAVQDIVNELVMVLVGMGEHDVVNRELFNDLFGSNINNANAWTWMVHGTLEDPWGTQLMLSGHVTRVFSNNGGFKINSQIVLH